MKRDATFFRNPVHDWQRRYEALRGSFVDRLPAKVIADRFGYTPGYVRLLRHLFCHGKIDFSEPVPESKVARRRVTSEIRQKIRSWRQMRLSAGEITELLAEEGIEISVRTVERVLAEEGFPKLPRRTRLKLGLTVKGTEIPEAAETVTLGDLDGQKFESPGAGVFLFAPFIAKLGLREIVQAAGLPGTKVLPAWNTFLSFLALKLLGTERYSHVNDHSFDPGLGLFAALNRLPKCTSMTSYPGSLDDVHFERLQRNFVKRGSKLGLYDGKVINLDFHTVPHFGDESVLEEHWSGSRNKTMKGALTLFAQDAESKLILYTSTDILKSESDDQVLEVLSFWRRVRRGVKPTFVFDSKFTTYGRLSRLNEEGVKFITLRKRGKEMLRQVEKLGDWKRVHIPHVKRKYKNPQIHESSLSLTDYDGELRQIIVRGTGHNKPTFIITNDFESPTELVVGHYSRRWRVENGIAEAVKFFHLNSISSPILTKVHFDVVLTMIADTLYSMLAAKLRGFERCDAQTLYRHFVRVKAIVKVHSGQVTITYPRLSHNPVLRRVPWATLPSELPGLKGGKLALRFR